MVYVYFDEIVRKIIFRRVKNFQSSTTKPLLFSMQTISPFNLIKSMYQEQKYWEEIKIDDLFVVLVILNWANYQVNIYHKLLILAGI